MDDDDVTTMPFILTRRHGGEYDDEAFSAGWNLGILDARLAIADVADLIIPPLVLKDKWKKQADLIAMAHNMVLRMSPLEEQPEYSVFMFAPPEAFKDAEDEDF